LSLVIRVSIAAGLAGRQECRPSLDSRIVACAREVILIACDWRDAGVTIKQG